MLPIEPWQAPDDSESAPTLPHISFPPRIAGRLPTPEETGDYDLTKRTYTQVDQFLEPPPQQAWAVQGVFPRPSLTLLVGDPGSKKSLLATDLAACVALGKPWLGSPVTQAPVIFVDEEAGFRRLWVRLNAALVTHAAPKGTPLHYISYGRYDFRDLKDCDELGMDAFHMQVGLIVIDALADVMGVGDENNVITMHAVLRNLRRLAHMAQAAILVVHHTNKSGTFRGSSAIAAGVDHMLRITSPVDESLIKLRTIKSRDINPVKIDARSSFNEGRFAIESVPYNGTSDLPGGFSLSPTALAILSHYRKGIVLSATTKDMLAAAPPNVSRLSARRVIYDLIESELILRVNSGGQGRKANYMISIKGRELLERLAKNNSQAA